MGGARGQWVGNYRASYAETVKSFTGSTKSFTGRTENAQRISVNAMVAPQPQNAAQCDTALIDNEHEWG